jgi:hypothetical protein
MATRLVLAAFGPTVSLAAAPASASVPAATAGTPAAVVAPLPVPGPPSLRPVPPPPFLLPAPVPAPAPASSTANEQHDPCTGELNGDGRLGPRWLPRGHQPVASLLRGYERTGELGPAAFLTKYWQGPADSGSWKYPPDDGFAEADERPDKERTELRPGEELDRFGSEYGTYLAPAGEPYAERALPPGILNTFDAAAPCNYHVYRVTRSFPVWRGSAAPWFEQPGGGRRIVLDPALLAPGEGQRLTVKWLLDNGYVTGVTG